MTAFLYPEVHPSGQRTSTFLHHLPERFPGTWYRWYIRFSTMIVWAWLLSRLDQSGIYTNSVRCGHKRWYDRSDSAFRPVSPTAYYEIRQCRWTRRESRKRQRYLSVYQGQTAESGFPWAVALPFRVWRLWWCPDGHIDTDTPSYLGCAVPVRQNDCCLLDSDKVFRQFPAGNRIYIQAIAYIYFL